MSAIESTPAKTLVDRLLGAASEPRIGVLRFGVALMQLMALGVLAGVFNSWAKIYPEALASVNAAFVGETASGIGHALMWWVGAEALKLLLSLYKREVRA